MSFLPLSPQQTDKVPGDSVPSGKPSQHPQSSANPQVSPMRELKEELSDTLKDKCSIDLDNERLKVEKVEEEQECSQKTQPEQVPLEQTVASLSQNSESSENTLNSSCCELDTSAREIVISEKADTYKKDILSEKLNIETSEKLLVGESEEVGGTSFEILAISENSELSDSQLFIKGSIIKVQTSEEVSENCPEAKTANVKVDSYQHKMEDPATVTAQPNTLAHEKENEIFAGGNSTE